jgi:hypothetical protein
MNKKLVIFAGIWAVIAIYFLAHVPDEPTRVMDAKVVALEDLDDRGNRLITVEFPDGSQLAIETTVPFFYKVGYTAHIAVHERYLFPDVYRIMSGSGT